MNIRNLRKIFTGLLMLMILLFAVSCGRSAISEIEANRDDAGNCPSVNEEAAEPTINPTARPTATPLPTPTPEPSATPTPTPTPLPTPTPTPSLNLCYKGSEELISSSDMFRESYFAILKERLQTYTDETIGDVLINSEFASYEIPYDPDDFSTYYIEDGKLYFYFEENSLTEGQPAFSYECDTEEALLFAYYDLEGNTGYRPVIRKLDPNKKMVALTFDDGPCPGVEKTLRNVFEKYDVRATFFSIGSSVDANERNRESMRALEAMGCEVASHTYDHIYFKTEDTDKAVFWHDINQANLSIAKALGHAPDYMRMPGGYLIDYMKYSPAPIIHWSVGTGDYSERAPKEGETEEEAFERKAKQTYKFIMSGIGDGAIVLMHSLYAPSAAATERVISELKPQGYEFVTLSELFYYKGVTPVNGKQYKKVN